MNIQKAVKQALKEDKCIRRKSINSGILDSQVLIKPTHSLDCCMVLIIGEKKGRKPRYWNPTADDLTADDWEVLRDDF